MAKSSFFRDHILLLLLSINGFLALGGVIFVLARLGSAHGSGYIVQYRSSLGVDAFEQGTVSGILIFLAFMILVFTVDAFLSLRAYKLSRNIALIVQSMTALLLVLSIIVSGALLLLH